jgi:hypothetical protein
MNRQSYKKMLYALRFPKFLQFDINPHSKKFLNKINEHCHRDKNFNHRAMIKPICF